MSALIKMSTDQLFQRGHLTGVDGKFNGFTRMFPVRGPGYLLKPCRMKSA
jgi:hypothetical protein